MLHYETVYPETLELLKELSASPELSDFFLVGGTAVSLHIGHRISVDLDFFSQKDINTDSLKMFLSSRYSIHNTITDVNTLSCFIKYKETSIKVEFISYKYDLLRPVVTIDGINLLELDDLIPMKLSAISGRGAKKDFCDIYFLLQKFSITQMLELYRKKFETENIFHLIKSLTYFDLADNDPEPIILDKVEWDKIKNRFIKEIKLIS